MRLQNSAVSGSICCPLEHTPVRRRRPADNPCCPMSRLMCTCGSLLTAHSPSPWFHLPSCRICLGTTHPGGSQAEERQRGWASPSYKNTRAGEQRSAILSTATESMTRYDKTTTSPAHQWRLHAGLYSRHSFLAFCFGGLHLRKYLVLSCFSQAASGRCSLTSG